MKCYCTAGRGTETFLKAEIYRRWADNVIMVTVEDGKVFFELRAESVQPAELLTLKSAERIFLLIFHEKATKIENPKTFIDNLIATGLSDRQAWYDCLAVWLAVNGQGNTENRSGGSEEPAKKRPRLSVDEGPVRFAVAMKCTGSVRYRLHPQRTPRQLAFGIHRHTGWVTDVRRRLIEVSVHLSDAFVTVGVPLVSKPLSKRSFIKHYGLRTTVAWIMVNLLDIQPGDTVLDPMCGKATILLEAAHSYKDAEYIGVDKDLQQLGIAQENVDFARSQGHTSVGLVQADVTGLPLPSASVNKIVTDAPFGHKHTTDGDIHFFYLHMLAEISRVLVPGGRLVLLTSPDLRRYVYSLLGEAIVDTNNQDTGDPHRNLTAGSDLKNTCTDSRTDGDNITGTGSNEVCLDNCQNQVTVSDVHKEIVDSNCKLKELEELPTASQDGKTNPNNDEDNNSICKNCDNKTCSCISKVGNGSSLPGSSTTSDLENNEAIETECLENSDVKSNTETKNKQELSKQIVLDTGAKHPDLTVKLKSFRICDSYYMKLGDTDSYIVVIQKLNSKVT